MTQYLNKFLDCFFQCIPKNTPLSLHEPLLDETDLAAVQETISSGWVSYQGPMVKRFEEDLTNYLQANVISVVNGTVALFLSLKMCGVGIGDEVIVPAISFVATSNAVHQTGATPHFIDIEEKTLGIDLDKLEDYLDRIGRINNKGELINCTTQRVIKAIIPVYILGTPIDFERLSRIAQKYNLQIIEDAAESLGSIYEEQKLGTLAKISALSFNGNKIITTGGGGAIVTTDKDLSQKIRHMVTTAKVAHPYEFEHDEVAYNFRLPALNAALGVSQLKKLDDYLGAKKKVFIKYQEAFSSFSEGYIFEPNHYGTSNNWLNAIILNSKHAYMKNIIIEHCINLKISLRPLWKPLHLLQINANCPKSDCSKAEELYQRVICLPSSVFLANA
jgi:perosamine synthetase